MRLIDADRLLTRKMKSKYYHLPNGDIAIPIIDIEHAPTVKPERKKGEWIHDGSQWANRWICSECEYKWFHSKEEAHFCPNCGADMRGDHE